MSGYPTESDGIVAAGILPAMEGWHLAARHVAPQHGDGGSDGRSENQHYPTESDGSRLARFGHSAIRVPHSALRRPDETERNRTERDIPSTYTVSRSASSSLSSSPFQGI